MRNLIPYFLACMLSLLTAVSGLSLAHGSNSKIVINSGAYAPLISADGKGFYNRLVNEIFRRLNIDVQCVQLPTERSLINANRGIDDGIIARIAGLEKKYPNLVRVPNSVLEYEFVAYSKTKLPQPPEQWKDLRPYVVGIIQGWKIYEKNVTDVKLLTKVNTPKQLFMLIENNRADIVMFDRVQGQWWLKRLGIDATMHQPALAKRKMYMYMHKKHSALVDPIAKTIADIKNDGTYKLILETL